MEKKVALAVDVRLSFLGIYGQSTLINEGANINVPQILQSQQALVCLWSISEKHSNAKSSMVSLHPVNYSQQGMLGFDVKSYEAVVQQISERFTEKDPVMGKVRGSKVRDRQEE